MTTPRPTGRRIERRRELLTVEAAAHRLSIGRTTMYALIRDDHIRTVQIGQRRLVPSTALAEYVARLDAEQNNAA